MTDRPCGPSTALCSWFARSARSSAHPSGCANDRSALRAEYRTVLMVRSLRSLIGAPFGRADFPIGPAASTGAVLMVRLLRSIIGAPFGIRAIIDRACGAPTRTVLMVPLRSLIFSPDAAPPLTDTIKRLTHFVWSTPGRSGPISRTGKPWSMCSSPPSSSRASSVSASPAGRGSAPRPGSGPRLERLDRHPAGSAPGQRRAGRGRARPASGPTRSSPRRTRSAAPPRAGATPGGRRATARSAWSTAPATTSRQPGPGARRHPRPRRPTCSPAAPAARPRAGVGRAPTPDAERRTVPPAVATDRAARRRGDRAARGTPALGRRRRRPGRRPAPGGARRSVSPVVSRALAPTWTTSAPMVIHAAQKSARGKKNDHGYQRATFGVPGHQQEQPPPPTSGSRAARSTPCRADRAGGQVSSRGWTTQSLANSSGIAAVPLMMCTPWVTAVQAGRPGRRREPRRRVLEQVRPDPGDEAQAEREAQAEAEPGGGARLVRAGARNARPARWVTGAPEPGRAAAITAAEGPPSPANQRPPPRARPLGSARPGGPVAEPVGPGPARAPRPRPCDSRLPCTRRWARRALDLGHHLAARAQQLRRTARAAPAGRRRCPTLPSSSSTVPQRRSPGRCPNTERRSTGARRRARRRPPPGSGSTPSAIRPGARQCRDDAAGPAADVEHRVGQGGEQRPARWRPAAATIGRRQVEHARPPAVTCVTAGRRPSRRPAPGRRQRTRCDSAAAATTATASSRCPRPRPAGQVACPRRPRSASRRAWRSPCRAGWSARPRTPAGAGAGARWPTSRRRRPGRARRPRPARTGPPWPGSRSARLTWGVSMPIWTAGPGACAHARPAGGRAPRPGHDRTPGGHHSPGRPSRASTTRSAPAAQAARACRPGRPRPRRPPPRASTAGTAGSSPARATGSLASTMMSTGPVYAAHRPAGGRRAALFRRS